MTLSLPCRPGNLTIFFCPFQTNLNLIPEGRYICPTTTLIILSITSVRYDMLRMRRSYVYVST